MRADSVYSATQGGLFNLWQADQTSAITEQSSGSGNFSDAYINDRAQFLSWKIQKNLNDIPDDVSIRRKNNGVESYLYTDKTLKNAQGQDYSVLVVGGNVPQQTDPIRISFAGDGGNLLQGGSYSDHLYGGRGRDTLEGGAGDDYLEGGAEVDTLVGGAGDDTLIGGKGDDILQGGAGNDVYLVRAGDGRDTIVDHEGRNTVVYEDANGRRYALGVAAFAVAANANTWSAPLAGGGQVSFTRNSPLTATLPDGSQIVIDDYQDGEYGIQLKDLAQSDATTLTILGDFAPVHFNSIYDDQGVETFWEPDEDELGNVIADPATPAPDTQDWLFGSDGNDLISGRGGVDWLYGRDGADHLQGGAGGDYVFGEAGNDLIEGQDENSPATGGDRLDGGAGDDRIYAATEIDIETALAQGNEAGLETAGAKIYGGPGDDVVVGSIGQDRISGGPGADVLIGGGGNDILYGESDVYSGWDPYAAADQGAAADDGDAIYGGSGDDVVFAGLGDDYVDGGDGSDTIFGEGGSDTLFGGAGDDFILAIVNDDVLDDGDDYIDGGDGNDYIAGSQGDNILLGGAGDDIIDGAGGNDFIDGGAGNDRIQGNDAHGGAGNDFVAGTSGADTLYGDDGSDVLAGWNYFMSDPYGTGPVAGTPGDDWLYGGAGDDTYLFAVGTGTAHIVDDSGANRIELLSFEIDFHVPAADIPYAPIARDSIRFEFQDGTYKLFYGNAGDCVELGAGTAMPALTLTHVVAGGPYSETLSWSAFALNQESAPAGGTLIATEGFSNTLVGKEGGDLLIGASGDDTLIGGAGDDTLDAGEGSDRYVFNPGDGIDVIADSGTQGTDTLAFGAGISADAITLGTGSLLIRIGSAGDAIHIDGFDWDNADVPSGIERFEFADGTVLTHAQLIARGFDLYGSAGDDTIFGTNLTDRFHASAGDDSLIGGAGDDTYYFELGSGRDTVIDLDTRAGNSDTVVLGSGITPENLSTRKGADRLTLAVAGASDTLAIQWQPQDGYAIERLQFADGTIWDGNMLESRALPDPQADGGIVSVADGSGIPAGSDAAALPPDPHPSPLPPERERGFSVPASSLPEKGPSASGSSPAEKGLSASGSSPAEKGVASSSSGTEITSSSPHSPDSGFSPSPPEPGERAGVRGVPAATLQSQQDDIATAMRTAAAIDSAASPSRKNTSPADYSDPQSAGWQSTSAQAAASFFTALQPAQPNLQTWLDNWFGPSARPSSSVRESSESNSFSEPGQSSPAQDVEPSNPQSDGPDMQPAEFLAPDEIAESYEEIQRWLAANPGVEHGIAGASGALPERNLFAGIGTSVTRDAGTIAMPRFGETPGMAAIAGNALQPLRGINEGYTTLGVL